MKFLILIALAISSVSMTALASQTQAPCPLLMQKKMLLSDVSPLPDVGQNGDSSQKNPVGTHK